MAITINAGVTLNHGLTFSANGGGGGGGGGATFTAPFRYATFGDATDEFTNTNGQSSPGLWIDGGSTTVTLSAKESEWTNTADFENLVAMPIGTRITVLPSGWYFISMITTSAWTLSGGIYSATVTGPYVPLLLNYSTAADIISITTYTTASYTDVGLTVVKDGAGYKYISAQKSGWATGSEYDTLEYLSPIGTVFTVVLSTGPTYTFTSNSQTGGDGTSVVYYGTFDPEPPGTFTDSPASITF